MKPRSVVAQGVYDGCAPSDDRRRDNREIVMRRTFVPLALAALARSDESRPHNFPRRTRTGPADRPASCSPTTSARRTPRSRRTPRPRPSSTCSGRGVIPTSTRSRTSSSSTSTCASAAADKQFSTDKVKGSMSDRGKVLFLMGKPLAVQNLLPGADEEEGNRPGFIERGATQIWMYTKDGKPRREEDRRDRLRLLGNQGGGRRLSARPCRPAQPPGPEAHCREARSS